MERLGAGDPLGVPPGFKLRGSVGGYRLLARLGAGGMGSVYLARSDRGRTVAVKLVRRELAEQEEFRARFRQEVQAARRVGGYWTAPVLDADTEADIPWVATGYVAGPTLQTVVSQDHGALPERSVRVLAAGLAHALRDIHAAGLIHRDLKPSNVLVTIDGPRVIDFGIARALETLTGAGFTRTGALVGSPGFMAPEQVRGDRVTPACDVFCLGSVLAYAATGTLPFGSADSGAHAMMFRIAQEDPDLEGLPEGLADLVRDCLRKDPAARPTPAQILERTGADDTLSEGRSREPWLPGPLVAQLGRHAVRLLDAEDPEEDPEDPEGQEDSGGPREPQEPQGPVGQGPQGPVGEGPQGPTGQGPQGPVGPGKGAARAADAPTAPAPFAAPTIPGPPPASDAPYGAVPPPPGVFGPAPQHPRSPAPGGWGTPPYGPPAYGDPAPARRSGRFTAVLIVVALLVALGAGGSVYAVLRGDGTGTTGGGTPSRTSAAPTTPGPSTPGQSSPSSSASASASAGTGSPGAVPDAYLGTWTAAIDNATGHNTRRLVIRQGGVGDTVLSLTADGDTYHCVFRAELAGQPAANGPLRIGPSTVTGGRPASSCTPGGATELTLLPDGRLKRVNTATGEALTYAKTG
ncbi:serine/threonine-protein kinase [Streptomyces sp. Ru72]|uniref:serine/threonine-protein kinase n=1 Tax=Streptomyces sp. Ru72 TaxID=2080747 RepID=UPI000CDD2A1A|nr:serine/threonine-protein kinase [Streptomyces sp. Ru72]POX53886.1 serine/threonine protein kinase [Streptomyces sp. Ru72]